MSRLSHFLERNDDLKPSSNCSIGVPPLGGASEPSGKHEEEEIEVFKEEEV